MNGESVICFHNETSHTATDLFGGLKMRTRRITLLASLIAIGIEMRNRSSLHLILSKEEAVVVLIIILGEFRSFHLHLQDRVHL